MATLKIREYSSIGDVYPGGTAPIAREPGVDQTPVTFTTTTQSAAFGAGTKYIAIQADAEFCYVVGKNPTATTGALSVAADTTLYIGVSPGDKIAVVTA